MASEWRANIHRTGNIGYLSDQFLWGLYHCELVAELVTPIVVPPFTFTHLLRYSYPAGRVTLYGRPVFGGWIAPQYFTPIPYQPGPFPHGYDVYPDVPS